MSGLSCVSLNEPLEMVPYCLDCEYFSQGGISKMLNSTIVMCLLAFSHLPTMCCPSASDNSGIGARELQGKWAIETVEINGVDMTEVLGGIPWLPQEFKIREHQLTITNVSKKSLVAELVVNKKRGPRELDVRFSGGYLMRGIYSIDGDVLLVCINRDHDCERPKRFSSKSEPVRAILILRKSQD